MSDVFFPFGEPSFAAIHNMRLREAIPVSVRIDHLACHSCGHGRPCGARDCPNNAPRAEDRR